MNDVDCKYSNGIVPYMYGELNGSSATEFETHLLECQTCTDEFAALSAARYEVYDWKKMEFDPLATPTFEIPYAESATTVTWIEKLRAAFAGWALPGFAMAGVAFLVVFGGVLIATRESDKHVAVADNKNAPVSNVSENRSAAEITPTVAEEKEPQEDTTASEQRSHRVIVVKDTVPKHASRGQQTVPRSAEATSTAPNKTREVPRLNDFSQEEDKSLRLAELFEDIDTSE